MLQRSPSERSLEGRKAVPCGVFCLLATAMIFKDHAQRGPQVSFRSFSRSVPSSPLRQAGSAAVCAGSSAWKRRRRSSSSSGFSSNEKASRRAAQRCSRSRRGFWRYEIPATRAAACRRIRPGLQRQSPKSASAIAKPSFVATIVSRRSLRIIRKRFWKQSKDTCSSPRPGQSGPAAGEVGQGQIAPHARSP